MKSLNEILSESLLDTDFDVSVEDVAVDNITNRIIEILSSGKFKNYDKTVKELRDLLKNTARKQQAQNANIMQKLRTEGNISICMYSSGTLHTTISIQNQDKPFRVLQLRIWLYRGEDGSGSTGASMIQPSNVIRSLDRDLKETLVFLRPEDWNEIVQAYMKS